MIFLGALVSDKAHHEKTNEIVTETLTRKHCYNTTCYFFKDTRLILI